MYSNIKLVAQHIEICLAMNLSSIVLFKVYLIITIAILKSCGRCAGATGAIGHPPIASLQQFPNIN
jgi:hypothetical protein